MSAPALQVARRSLSGLMFTIGLIAGACGHERAAFRHEQSLSAGSRHEHFVDGVRMIRSGAEPTLVTTDGHDARVWSIKDTPTWALELRRVIPQVKRFFNASGVARSYVVFAGETASSMFWTGEWQKPVLDASQGLPAAIDEVWRILPSSENPRWMGAAVRSRPRDDAPWTWRLFQTADADRWQPLPLPGVRGDVRGFRRLGAGEIAAADDKGWKLFQQTVGGNWEPLHLAGPVAASIQDVTVLDDDSGGLQLSWHDPQGGPAIRGWYVRGARGRWVGLGELIPGLRSRIVEVRFIGRGQVLAIQSGSEAAADPSGNSIRWTFFLSRGEGTWKRLSDVLPGCPDEIYAVKSFSDSRGLAVFDDPAFKTEGTSGHWRYYWRGDDGNWGTLERLPIPMPNAIWQIGSFAGDRGLGLQNAGSNENAASAFRWDWFFQWRRVDELLPGAPRQIWAIRSEDTSLIEIEDPTLSRSWYVQLTNERWGRLQDIVSGVPQQVKAVAMEASDILRVEDGARPYWFARANEGR